MCSFAALESPALETVNLNFPKGASAFWRERDVSATAAHFVAANCKEVVIVGKSPGREFESQFCLC